MSELHERFLTLAATSLDFDLSRADAAELQRHLTTCPACSRALDGMRADANTMRALPMRVLNVGRSSAILGHTLGPRTELRNVRMLAFAAILALLLVGLAAVGSELLRRDVQTVAPLPTAPTQVDETSPPAIGWAIAAPLSAPRTYHTASLLPDGRVLVAGGTALDVTTEIFDPATNTWSRAADARDARQSGVALALHTGTIFVAGGYDRAGPVAGVEIFARDQWLPGPALLEPRGDPAAVELPDGTILVIGGNGSANFLDSAERVSVETGRARFTAGSLSTRRYGHTATLLGNGLVLVVGGAADEGASLATAELFDPTTDSWRPAAAMHDARSLHTATLLPDGRVLIAGGTAYQGLGVLASAEIYNPATDAWVRAGAMADARSRHAAIAYGGGRVLVVGGGCGEPDACGDAGLLGSTELFDPTAGTWVQGPTLRVPRRYVALVGLRNGGAMVIGGETDAGVTAEVEILGPSVE